MGKTDADIRAELFVRAYLGEAKLNGTEAAIIAGFSPRTADSQASQLLRKPKVKRLLEIFRAKLDGKFVITRERILNELAKMGFANMADYMRVDADGAARLDLSALTRDQAAAIQELTIEETTEGKGDDKYSVRRTRFKLANKRESLELLGRHHKLFDDAGQVNVGVKVILVDIPRPDRTPELPEDVPTE